MSQPKGRRLIRQATDQQNRLHQRRLMNCGQECEIIEYRSSVDIDVQFVSSQQIVSGRRYDDFLSGSIKDPAITCNQHQKAQRLGAKLQMNSGLWAIVHEYRRCDDIDVLFEIDGAISHNKRWKDFCKGKIAHPSVAPNYDRESRLHEVREMRNGRLAEIIAYRKSDDIDVKFVEDDAMVLGTTYALFEVGKIAHPTIKTIFDTSLQEFSIRYYLGHLSGNPWLFNSRDESTKTISNIASPPCPLAGLLLYYMYERKLNSFKDLRLQYQLPCGVVCKISQANYYTRD